MSFLFPFTNVFFLFQDENVAASVSCKTCGRGNYAISKEVACKACASGQFQETEAAIEYECKFCAAGFAFATKSTVCSTCASGKYQEENAGASVSCKFCAKGMEFTAKSTACSYCAEGLYQIHHELYAFAKCCPASTTTQSKDQPECKSIEVTSVVPRQAASDGVSVGLPLPPEGALPVFALESYRGTNILDVKFTAKNFEHLSSESDVAELWVWVTSTSLSGSVEPMFAPTSVVLPFDQAIMYGEISIPVPWTSDTSTTFAVLDGVGGSLTKNNLVCSNIIDRDTVIFITDKKEMVWNAPEAMYRVGNTDKHTDNTRVQSNKYPMKYLANDIPTLPSSYVHVRPRVIYESTPGKKIFLKMIFFGFKFLKSRLSSHSNFFFFLFLFQPSCFALVVSCVTDALEGRTYGSFNSHVRDRDSPNRRITGFSFAVGDGEMDVVTTSSTSGFADPLDPVPQYAPKKNERNLYGQVGCRILGINDGCVADGGASSASSASSYVSVSNLTLSPSAGTSIGGNMITVTGSGFALDDSQGGPFTLMFEDISAVTPRDSMVVTCEPSEFSTQVQCKAPLFDKAAAAKVTLQGPTVAYKGCFDLSSWKNSVFLGNKMSAGSGGSSIRRSTGGLASCQHECNRKEKHFDMFGLVGSDCYCGKSDEFDSGASVVLDDRQCSEWCRSPLDRLSFEEIGCYELSVTNDIVPDLPVVGGISQVMNQTKCSNLCNGFDYFGLVGSSRCFCGNNFHKDHFKTTSVDDSKCNMPCGGGTANEKCGGVKHQLTFRQSVSLSTAHARDSFGVDAAVSPGSRCGSYDNNKVSLYEIRQGRKMQAGIYDFGKGPATKPRNVRVKPILGGMIVSWIQPVRLGGYNDVRSYDWHLTYGIAGTPFVMIKMDNGAALDPARGCNSEDLQPGEVRLLPGDATLSAPLPTSSNENWENSCATGDDDPPCPCSFGQPCKFDTWCTVIYSSKQADNVLYDGEIKYKSVGVHTQYMCPCHPARKEKPECWQNQAVKTQCDAGFIRCDHYCSTNDFARSEDIKAQTSFNELMHQRSDTGLLSTENYVVQVLAENPAGGSMWSLPALSTKRDPENPSKFLARPEAYQFPLSVAWGDSGKSSESSLIYLKWLTPSNQGSPVTHYIVETERLDDWGESACHSVDEIRVEATIENRNMGTISRVQSNGMVEDTRVPFTVAHPKKYQEAMVSYPWETGAIGFKSASWYKLRVQAVNAQGRGEWSARSKKQTEDETQPKKILGEEKCPKTMGENECMDDVRSNGDSNMTFSSFSTLSVAMEWMAPPRLLPTFVKGSNVFDQALGRGGQELQLLPSHKHGIGTHEACFKSARASLIGLAGSRHTTVNCGGHRCFVSGFVEKTRQWMFARVIKGITFINGSSTNVGGFFYIYGFQDTFGMNIEDIVFKNGAAGMMGGAIMVEHSYLYNGNLGGKILIAATFVGCVAGKYGGGVSILSSDAVFIEGSKFVGVRAGLEGGAIMIGPLKKRASAVVATCYIETCVCDASDPLRQIVGKCPVDVVDTQFSEKRGRTTILNTTFEENLVTSDSGGLGGAILLEESDLVVEGCLFKDNRVNAVLGLGGAIYSRSGKTWMEHSIITGNIAGGGGGLAFVASSLEVDSSTISNNKGNSSGGGAMQLFFSEVTLSSNVVNMNEGQNGGAVLVGPKTSLTSVENIWRDNVAVSKGGAFYADQAESLDINNNKFIRNKAFSGGAISILASSGVRIYSSTFQENGATGSSLGGGALFVDLDQADVTIRVDLIPVIESTTKFIGNHASEGVGGAILWTACDKTMGNADLLPLVVFKETTGNAHGNKASSGSLIASTAQQLVLIQGPHGDASKNNVSTFRGYQGTGDPNELLLSPTTCTLAAAATTTTTTTAESNSQCSSWTTWPVQKVDGTGERSSTKFQVPWSLRVLDYYGQLSTISSQEITVRSTTSMSKEQCVPFHGILFDKGLCHFQQISNVERSMFGVVNFDEYEIKGLPSAVVSSVMSGLATSMIHLEFVLNLDSRTNTWLNRLETNLDLGSCLPGEFLLPESRKCVKARSGFYASDINDNTWMIREAPEMWLKSNSKQWLASCPVGTYGEAERVSSNICQMCPAGYFTDKIESESCTKCQIGLFGSSLGMGRCQACERGTFSDQLQMLQCKSCSEGQYREMPSQEITCKHANDLVCDVWRNTSVSNKNIKCMQCPTGFWTTLTKRHGSCVGCPPGMFGVQKIDPNTRKLFGTCHDCAYGKFSPNVLPLGTTLCQDCKAGKWTGLSLVGEFVTEYKEIKSADTEEQCIEFCSLQDDCRASHYVWLTDKELPKWKKYGFIKNITDFGSSAGGKFRCIIEGPTLFTNQPVIKKIGQAACHQCLRGEMSEPGNVRGQCRQCTSSSRVPTSEVSEASGEYNFQQGRLCNRCPLGAICYDGRSMEAGWGWWISAGTESGKKQLQATYLRTQKNHTVHENVDICQWIDVNVEDNKMKKEVEKADIVGVDYEQQSCDSPCRYAEIGREDDRGEEGCICRRRKSGSFCFGIDDNLKESKSALIDNTNDPCRCRRSCTASREVTPWASTFYDPCGSYRKVVRCDGYRTEQHCGNLQTEALEKGGTIFDQHGISTVSSRNYFELPNHCQKCRRTTIQTIQQEDREDVFTVTYTLAGSRTKTYQAVIDMKVNGSMLSYLKNDTYALILFSQFA